MAPTSKAFVTVLLSLALCQIIAAEPSLEGDGLADKIVKGIKQTTILSDNLRKEIEIISEDNADIWGIIIPRGFEGIDTQISAVTDAISSASQSSSLSDDEAKRIVETLKTFIQVQQKLLHVLNEKHDIRPLVPYSKSILSSLRKLKSEVNSDFRSVLIKVIPTQKEVAEKKFRTFKEKIDETIQFYEENLLFIPHGDSPVEAIQEGLTTFLQAQQELLNVLNDKHGITTDAGDLA